MRRTILRLLSSFRSSRAERELAREIRSHLQLLEDQYIARGMDAEEARYAALRAFGGVEQVKEHQREARMFRWLAGWPMDLKLGGRMLVKYPGLTIVGGLAMAFAIWVGIVIFQVVSLFIHPTLPVSAGRAPGRNSQHGRGGERSREKGPPRLPRVAAVAAIADRRRRLARLEPKPRSSPPAMRVPSTSPR